MNKRSPDVQNNRTAAAPSLLRALWQGTCTRYTVLCIILLLSQALYILAEPEATHNVNIARFLLLFPFALTLTAATLVRRSDKLPNGARYALHPLLCLGGFYLCFYLPYQIGTKPSGQQILMVVLLAVILYGIIMGIYALVTRKSRQKKIDNTPYVSQFGNK